MTERQTITALRACIRSAYRNPTRKNVVVACEVAYRLTLLQIRKRSGRAGQTKRERERTKNLIRLCRKRTPATFSDIQRAYQATHELYLACVWDRLFGSAGAEREKRCVIGVLRDFQDILKEAEPLMDGVSRRKTIRAFWANESFWIAKIEGPVEPLL